MRVRRSGLLGSVAWCDDCDFDQTGKNALPLAAKHVDIYPDHRTHVEQTIGVTYYDTTAIQKAMDT